MLEPMTPGSKVVDALEVGNRLSELEMERGLAVGTALGRRRFRVYRDGTYRITSDDRDHARGFSRARFLNAHR